MSYPLIRLLQQKATPVQQSCRALEVSRSGFYEARSCLTKPMICKTSIPQTHLPIAANILDRQFNPVAPNIAWVSDITYIRTGSGWLHLAIVLDLFSRKVVGCDGAEHAR